ncbi:hypothetical protein BZG36_03111 [Bifiguratus adelaidae]|uniref:CRAL-TRIO domain-containing protein n=1 Tax=Bifiguratus adelaidae TaxID=1938954 RepID=A0A261Y0K5_9FUNG|nr:hypothetical protein BZG36_03111 [Bifiguratus adelaidae]
MVPPPEEKRQACILQFRELLGPDGQNVDIDTAQRYLIARSWDVPAAINQYTKTLQWRAQNRIDDIPVATPDNGLPALYAIRGYSSLPDQNLEAAPGVAENVLRIATYMGGSGLHKFDRDGCPVYIERLGLHDVKGLAKNCTMEEVLTYHLACNEFLHRIILKEASERAGHKISRESVIFDCTGMGWHQFHMPGLQFLRGILDIDQSYYPETMNNLYLINTPSAFVMVWKIVKAWMDPGLIAKVHILGSDYQPILRDKIGAENLPTFLGGECQCQAPGGCLPNNREHPIPKATEQNPTLEGKVYSDEVVAKAHTTQPDFSKAAEAEYHLANNNSLPSLTAITDA